MGGRTSPRRASRRGWSRGILGGATSSIIASGYGRFLSFLAETGDLNLIEIPAARITRGRVEAYVAYLRERNHSSTTAARILQLVRATAVMVPTTDWTWLRRIRARLRHMATPARDDRARLVPCARLLDLAVNLMERAEAERDAKPYQRALWFRDGLMIGMLCAVAPRARNIAGTFIGRNLQRRGEVWWVCYGAHETKNKRPLELPLPDFLSISIER